MSNMQNAEDFYFEPPFYPPPVKLKGKELNAFLDEMNIQFSTEAELTEEDYILQNLQPEETHIKINPLGILRPVPVDTKDNIEIVQDAVSFLSDSKELIPLILNTVDLLKKKTNSISGKLYLVTEANNEIFEVSTQKMFKNYVINWRIQPNSTFAVYIARTKTPVMVDDVCVDQRFPLGIGNNDILTKAAIACPLLSTNGDVIGLIELSRQVNSNRYTDKDMALITKIAEWFSQILSVREKFEVKKRSSKTDELFSELFSKHSENIIDDSAIYDVLDIFVQQLKVKSAFYYDLTSNTQNITAYIYESGKYLPKSLRKKKDLLNGRSVASFVARRHAFVNIHDVSVDPRFDVKEELMTYASVSSSMCDEVLLNKKIVGILQVNNKENNAIFMKHDEELFHKIKMYLSLVLNQAQQRNKIDNLSMEYALLENSIERHLKPCFQCESEFIQRTKNKLNVMSYKVREFHYLLDENCITDSMMLCHLFCSMLPNILGTEAILASNIIPVVLILNCAYDKMSMDQRVTSFYTFHIVFNIVTRIKDLLKFTDKLSLVICALFSSLIKISKDKKEDEMYHLMKLFLKKFNVNEHLSEIDRIDFYNEVRCHQDLYNEHTCRDLLIKIQNGQLITKTKTEKVKLLTILASHFYVFTKHYNFIFDCNKSAIHMPLKRFHSPDQFHDYFVYLEYMLDSYVNPLFKELSEISSDFKELLNNCLLVKNNIENIKQGEYFFSDWKVY